MVQQSWIIAATLLSCVSIAFGHGEDNGGMEGVEMPKSGPVRLTDANGVDLYDVASYAGLTAHSSSMLAHIVLMTLAWFFILPVGVMFSVGRSKLAFPVQCLFLVVNGIGVFFGTFYNVNTPDFYENNAHHKIGWIATWIATAHVVMSLLFIYSGRDKSRKSSAAERVAFLPLSVENMSQHSGPRRQESWGGDSGQGTEPASPRSHSRDMSPSDSERVRIKPESNRDDFDDVPLRIPKRSSFWRIKRFDKFLSQRVPGLLSGKIINIAKLGYNVVDRVILILGWIALMTGLVTYTGIFRGNNVFNGAAHFVKGGIFFWYGLLTLGRWMGCFADLGWAWNVKPSRSQVGQWKANIKSAEFVESAVIFTYGCTNVWLEHLAAWGSAWSAQDFEHVSISIMFLGGGLCGMLVESKTIRTWLNTSVDSLPAQRDADNAEAQKLLEPPTTYNTSLNVFPALIILLLGLMMSSHHQESMVSTEVHTQWGTLLCGFSLARAVTYMVMYIRPPSSIYPSRPPSELIASFCLISGGLVFMASTKDIMHWVEVYNLMAMFIFTVTMGLTAFIMAYAIFVISLKGWAIRRENRFMTTPY